eukprot:scaffold3741_cov114-Isochrysis_galbana.AAC.3
MPVAGTGPAGHWRGGELSSVSRLLSISVYSYPQGVTPHSHAAHSPQPPRLGMAPPYSLACVPVFISLHVNVGISEHTLLSSSVSSCAHLPSVMCLF